MPSSTTLTGAAGEHYVLSELLRRGYVAGLAPTGAANIDIVASNKDGSRFASIQVKTWNGKGLGWQMSEKHEQIAEDRLFYVFVDFHAKQENVRPSVYVVPSKIIAPALKEEHRQYLLKPGRDGLPRKTSRKRTLMLDYSRQWDCGKDYGAGWLDKYKDAWESLGLKAIDANEQIGEAADD
jgi:hypothetical protein